MTEKAVKKKSVKSITSKELFADAKEIIISHQEHDYRLRITSNDKLILTK